VTLTSSSKAKAYRGSVVTDMSRYAEITLNCNLHVLFKIASIQKIHAH